MSFRVPLRHVAPRQNRFCHGPDASQSTLKGQSESRLAGSQSRLQTVRKYATTRTSTHYDALQLPPSASPAEIKKAFYKLSKAYHPDLQDQSADEQTKKSNQNKFYAISDAYKVLGDPEKKEKYDREHIPSSRGSSPMSPGHASSSSASSFAGGRTASGLSKRRTHFRGPPPSFYRNGGYAGAGAGAREEAQARAQSGAYRGTSAGGQPGGGTQRNGYGDDGAWPFNTDANDVPHFDRASHYKTTTSVEDQLRQGRRKRRKAWIDRARAEGRNVDESSLDYESVGVRNEQSVNKTTLILSGVMAIGVGVPVIWMNITRS